MGFQDVLYPVCAAINYAAAADRLPGLLRGRRDPQSLALIGSFVAIGTTFALATPAIWVRVDAFIGAPNAAALIYQSLVIAYTACIQFVLLHWTDPATARRRMRWRLALALATIAAMTVLFVLADVNDQRTRDFMAHYVRMPIMGAYALVYLITFAIGRVDVARLCLTYAPRAGRLWLRRGLYWTAAGSVFGLIYFVARMADIVTPALGANPLHWEVGAALAAVACSVLTMVGLTMPSWGPPLSRPAEWVRRYVEFRALHPLWLEVTDQFPSVRLAGMVPSRRALPHRPKDLTLWLSRMKTEIRDAQMALGQALHSCDLNTAARTKAEAAGYRNDDLEAIVQAAGIGYGLQEKARRGKLTGSATAAELHGGDDTVSEVRFLIKVARARHAPIVGDIISAFRDDRPVLTP